MVSDKTLLFDRQLYLSNDMNRIFITVAHEAGTHEGEYRHDAVQY